MSAAVLTVQADARYTVEIETAAVDTVVDSVDFVEEE